MTDPFHPLSVRDIPLLTHYFARQDTRLCNASAGAAVLWPYPKHAIPEPKIVIRFWIVGILLAALTFVTLKIR